MITEYIHEGVVQVIQKIFTLV